MTQTAADKTSHFDPEQFHIADLEDEVRADRLVGALLRAFFEEEVSIQGETPEDAGRMARGADYFLREFIIGDRRENIYRIEPQRVRQFAGNWYIVRNLEPNIAELGDILEGVAACYQFLARRQLVAPATAKEINAQCDTLDFYRERIESFWQIEGDGYQAWNDACPLPAT